MKPEVCADPNCAALQAMLDHFFAEAPLAVQDKFNAVQSAALEKAVDCTDATRKICGLISQAFLGT